MVKFLKGHIRLKTIIQIPIPTQQWRLVSSYIIERGLILEPFEVDAKTNVIKALPELIEKMALLTFHGMLKTSF